MDEGVDLAGEQGLAAEALDQDGLTWCVVEALGEGAERRDADPCTDQRDPGPCAGTCAQPSVGTLDQGARTRNELAAAARLLEQLAEEWGPNAPHDSEAKTLARDLEGLVPVLFGAGPTVAVARRWKAQVNENAKRPAFDVQLPEADHNEICAWEGAGGRFAGVFLDGGSLPPRMERRLELTAGLVAATGAPMRRVRARGETPLERVLSLVFLGDLVSVYLAVLAGVDPTPVEQIERFKRTLGSVSGASGTTIVQKAGRKV